MSIVNVYLQSGTDHESKMCREEYINNIPNLLLYRKKDGLFGGQDETFYQVFFTRVQLILKKSPKFYGH